MKALLFIKSDGLTLQREMSSWRAYNTCHIILATKPKTTSLLSSTEESDHENGHSYLWAPDAAQYQL